MTGLMNLKISTVWRIVLFETDGMAGLSRFGPEIVQVHQTFILTTVFFQFVVSLLSIN